MRPVAPSAAAKLVCRREVWRPLFSWYECEKVHRTSLGLHLKRCELPPMRIHLIAIGGSAMHNFALALADSGHHVTGSDDQIFEPSRGRLEAAGLLPEREGWHPEGLTSDIDVVILGMHARTDNPELRRANELGLTIQSYPEFLRSATKDKQRLVVAGSHGKTTVTSMVLHACHHAGMSTDIMVGAQLEGFERMVELKPDHDWAVIEGDEYLSSPVDRRPKFLWYAPHVTVVTGISWDHVNVFPTEDVYMDQFRQYLRTVEQGGTVIHCEEDVTLAQIVDEVRLERADIAWVGYRTPQHTPMDRGSEVTFPDGQSIQLSLLGEHNMQNLSAAREACSAMGMSKESFAEALATFKGAARRLEVAHEEPDQGFTVFRDFAHAPSKLAATQAAIAKQFPNREVTAVFELHTFSSLSREFLPQYNGAMDHVSHAIVYFDPAVVKQKRLPDLEVDFVQQAFGRVDLEVITDAQKLEARIQSVPKKDHVLLMMSSGRFGGIDIIPTPRQETS